jgi:hypothetical protein
MIDSSVCAGQEWWSGAGSNRRPSAFQAWRMPSCRRSCECCVLPPIAADSRWLLLLLSPLLSAWLTMDYHHCVHLVGHAWGNRSAPAAAPPPPAEMHLQCPAQFASNAKMPEAPAEVLEVPQGLLSRTRESDADQLAHAVGARPRAVATRPGLSLTAMLASADDAMQSRAVSPRSARSGVSWSQSRSQGPYSGQKGRGLVVPSEWMV